jgi:hypothetical protein
MKRAREVLVRDNPKLPDDGGKAPKLHGVVGGSIPSREIVSLLDGNWSSGQTPHVLPKKTRNKRAR